MSDTPVRLPIKGVTDAQEVEATPPDRCPPASMLNVWPVGSDDRRVRLTKRAGLVAALTDSDGNPWRAPSYIQGFAQVNIAQQTRIDPGGTLDNLLDDTNPPGGGSPIVGEVPDRQITFVDNLNYEGTPAGAPPVMGSADYEAVFGFIEGVAAGEDPHGLTAPHSKWDRYSPGPSGGYEQDILFVAYNYWYADSGLGVNVNRARIIAVRRNASTHQFEVVNEYELSDGIHTGAPANGKINFSRPGDANKPWHISINAIDTGPDYIYAALYAAQTATNERPESGATVTAQRGWVVAIPRGQFLPGVTVHAYPPNLNPINGLAREAVGVLYRPVFSPVVTNPTTGVTYGLEPDLLVLFEGYLDHQSGIARFTTDALSQTPIGDYPTWRNAGHGRLRTSYVGLSEEQLDAAGPSALAEGNHGTCRLSVVTNRQRGTDLDTTNNMGRRWTHGRLPTWFDISSNGEIFVASSAIGWGVPDPDGTETGYAATYSVENQPNESVPRVNLCRLTPDGRLVWETVTDVFVPSAGYSGGGGGPFFNDRYAPTLNCVVADRNGGCLAVGKWVNGANVWHVRTVGPDQAAVDWRQGIGLPRGAVKDDTGATTRVEYGETIGVGELTMFHAALNEQTIQYYVTGEAWPVSTVVGASEFGSGTPPPGQWYVLSGYEVPNADFGGAVVWKLAGNGAPIWKRLPGSPVVGFSVAARRPFGSSLNGAWVALAHSDVSGTNLASTIGWTFNSTARYWWLRNDSGNNVTTGVVFRRPLNYNEEGVLRFRKRIHGLRARIKASPDLRTGWEVGTIKDGGVWKLVIRKVRDNVPEGVLDEALLDDLGVTSDQEAFDVRFQITAETINVYVNTQPTNSPPALQATLDEFLSYDRWGFVGDFQTTATGQENDPPYTDTTAQVVRVSKAEVNALIPVQIQAQELGVVFSDGRMFVFGPDFVVTEESGLNMRRFGKIRAAQHKQTLYIIDGRNARRYRPTMPEGQRIDNWVPTTGTLPGALRDSNGRVLPGTSTATHIATFLDAVWLTGMADDPNNVRRSRLGDALDWNPDSPVIFGRSTSLANEIAGVAGVPIHSLFPYQDDFMLLGSTGQINILRGDPAIEGSRVDNISRDVGLPGPDALAFTDTGAAYGLTEQGLAAIAGGLQMISPAVLHTYAVASTHEGTVEPLAIRDGSRYGVLLCFTRIAAEDWNPTDIAWFNDLELSDGTKLVSTHLWYSEQTGGFYPLRFQPQADPIVVFKYRDTVLLGSRDGVVRRFDDAATEDYDPDGSNDPIEAYLPTELLRPESPSDGIQINRTTITLARGSASAVAHFKGAATAEEVYSLAPNEGAFSVNLVEGRQFVYDRVSGAVCLITFYHNAEGSTFAVERVAYDPELITDWMPPVEDAAPQIPPDDNLGACPAPAPTGVVLVSPGVADLLLGADSAFVFSAGPGGGGPPSPGIDVAPPPADISVVAVAPSVASQGVMVVSSEPADMGMAVAEGTIAVTSAGANCPECPTSPGEIITPSV